MASVVVPSVPYTSLGLTNDEIRLLQRHQIAATSTADASSFRASSQGLLLLDGSSLAVLSRHFDLMMRQISDRLDDLSQQSSTAGDQLDKAAGNSIEAETAIARFTEILRQIDELDDDFDRIKHIRDIVRGYRERAEQMERSLSLNASSQTGKRSRRSRSSMLGEEGTAPHQYSEAAPAPVSSHNQPGASAALPNTEKASMTSNPMLSQIEYEHKIVKGPQQEDLATSTYDIPSQADTIRGILSANDSYIDEKQELDMTIFSRDSGYASASSKNTNAVPKYNEDIRDPSMWDSHSTASLHNSPTEITLSSVNPTAIGGAAEELAETLMQDEMIYALVQEGYQKLNADHFERNFRRILKQYAFDLRKEAKNELEKGAVRIIYNYRAYVTRIIGKKIAKVKDERALALDDLQIQKTSKLALERFLEQLRVTDTYTAAASAEDYQLDSNSSSEFSNDDNPYLPNLEKVKEFLIMSTAFVQLGQRLQEFLGPLTASQPALSNNVSSSAEERTSKRRKELGKSLLVAAQNGWTRAWRTKPAKGYKRIEWTCGCGHDLYADFKDTSQRKLDRIAAILQRSPNPRSHPHSRNMSQLSSSYITTPQVVHISSGSSFNASKGSSSVNQDSNTSLSTSHRGKSAEMVDNLRTPSFLELCVNTGEHLKTLGEIDLTNFHSDGDLFNAVRENYARLRSFRAKFWLLKPATVSYVRFSLENRHRVGILQKPLSLPPKSEVDAQQWIYDPCPPDGDPPIAEGLFLHYLQCTERSGTLFWTLRLPRKLQVSILSNATTTTVFGWGIHIDEGPNLVVILWANFVVVVLSGIAALLWNFLEHDFQGAFGFASWIIMVLNSLLIAYVFKWKQE